MKKTIAFLLALLMTLSTASVALAEAPELEDDPNLITIPEHVAKLPENSERAASRSDTVEITDTTIAVVTGDGLGITYKLPADLVYVLTQDVLQQYELYEKFYDDPIAVAREFAENGTHLNIYDPMYDLDIFVDVGVSVWSVMYPNTDALNEADVAFLQSYFNRNGFDVATTSTVGTLGGNTYFFFDCMEAKGFSCLLASVDGYEISIYFAASTAEQVQRAIDLLDGLTITSLS